MIVYIGVDRLNDDSVTDWKVSLGYDSETFVLNRKNFPINVLFAVLVTAAPVFVTLSGASDRPVSSLTFFGAVSPPLAAATLLDEKPNYFFQAEGTVPNLFSILEKVHNIQVIDPKDDKKFLFLKIIVHTISDYAAFACATVVVNLIKLE